MDTQATGFERRDATEEEIKTLPHVVDSIPLIIWIALVAGELERFKFYAVTDPWPVTQVSIKTFGLALAMVLLGLGTGGIKATVSPFIGDQYTVLAPQLVAMKKGERVIVDRTLTLRYIYNVFYWFTNIGSLYLIASTYLEKEVGFWAAYLLPLCSVGVSIPLLLFWQKSFVKLAPDGNFLPQAGKVLVYSARERFRLDAAKPAFQAEKYGRKIKLSAIPNDTIQALNPIACVLLGPIIQKLLYPGLQKYGIVFESISRLQKLICTQGPCYESPRNFPDSNGGKIPNNITPKDMRSLVQALRQVTAATGSAFGIALSPVAVDPKVMYLYTGLTATMIAAAPTFWVAFMNYDKVDDEDELNEVGLMQDSHNEMEETTARAHP
ncbi:hypothetical protein LT330_008234 [Penicillium expansum]|nr:hypothetical protein LT330_008234 [Penicillium expansum]